MSVISEIRTQAMTSPFDLIREVDAQGRGFWSARKLGSKPCLNYASWQMMLKAIRRAEIACRNSGHDPADHFNRAINMIEIGKGGQREVEDIHLSRYACYLVAMNGDPAKPEVAAAQRYFVEQTRLSELAGDRVEITDAIRKIEEQAGEIAAIRDELALVRRGVFLGIISPSSEAPANWFPVIPWAKDRGIEFKTLGEKSIAGNQVSDIAKRMGFTPCKARYKGKGRERTHYPPQALEKWLAVFLRANPVHRYPSLFGIDTEPSPRRAKHPG